MPKKKKIVPPPLVAKVLGQDEMSRQQREAASAIKTLVERMAKEPHERDGRSLPWAAVAARCSPRVVLIDGQRGTGKTSVLLTLVSEWNSAGDARALRILDLDPLPSTTSLLAWLMQPFGEVATWLESSGQPTPQAPGPSLRERWDELAATAIVGWDGVRAKVDHESLGDWAYDQHEQVSNWYVIQERWRCFIDDMLKQLQPRGVSMLIVPVDDVDLRIDVAKSFMLACRLLWHPRVAFLLAADRDVLAAGHELHLLAQLGVDGAGDAAVAALFEALPHHKVRELVSAFMDKEVPRAQSARLPLLLPEDTLSYVRKNAADVTSIFSRFFAFTEMPITLTWRALVQLVNFAIESPRDDGPFFDFLADVRGSPLRWVQGANVTVRPTTVVIAHRSHAERGASDYVQWRHTVSAVRSFAGEIDGQEQPSDPLVLPLVALRQVGPDADPNSAQLRQIVDVALISTTYLGVRGAVELSWPTPPAYTLSELRRRSERLEALVASTPADDGIGFATAWLEAVVLDEASAGKLQPSRRRTRVADPGFLAAILRAAAEVAGRDWSPAQLTALGAPEYGLPFVFQDALLLALYRIGVLRRGDMRDARWEELSNAAMMSDAGDGRGAQWLPAAPTDLAGELRQRLPGAPWHAYEAWLGDEATWWLDLPTEMGDVRAILSRSNLSSRRRSVLAFLTHPTRPEEGNWIADQVGRAFSHRPSSKASEKPGTARSPWSETRELCRIAARRAMEGGAIMIAALWGCVVGQTSAPGVLRWVALDASGEHLMVAVERDPIKIVAAQPRRETFAVPNVGIVRGTAYDSWKVRTSLDLPTDRDGAQANALAAWFMVVQSAYVFDADDRPLAHEFIIDPGPEMLVVGDRVIARPELLAASEWEDVRQVWGDVLDYAASRRGNAVDDDLVGQWLVSQFLRIFSMTALGTRELPYASANGDFAFPVPARLLVNLADHVWSLMRDDRRELSERRRLVLLRWIEALGETPEFLDLLDRDSAARWRELIAATRGTGRTRA